MFDFRVWPGRPLIFANNYSLSLLQRIKNVLYKARNDHKSAVTERIEQAGQMKDIVDVTKNLFALSRETAKLEAEAFELKQQVAVASEVKATLDSWVRYEATVREREQKQLAAYLIEKIQKDLEDPKIQQQILDQAVVDVQSKYRFSIGVCECVYISKYTKMHISLFQSSPLNPLRFCS
jgi:F-type H+-transporting ATPase subunit b